MVWNPGDDTDLNEGGAGTDTVTDLYWNLGLQAWNQSGDRVSLIDAEGRLIESVPIAGNPAAMIKSHHNVGGLPKNM